MSKITTNYVVEPNKTPGFVPIADIEPGSSFKFNGGLYTRIRTAEFISPAYSGVYAWSHSNRSVACLPSNADVFPAHVSVSHAPAG